MSPELPVERSARERFVKACIKLGLPLDPRKRPVHAGVGSSVGWRLRWQLGQLCHERKEKLERHSQNGCFLLIPGLVGTGAATFLRSLRLLQTPNFLLFSVMCTEEVMNTRKTVGSRLLQVSNWKRSLPARCCSLRRQSLAFVAHATRRRRSPSYPQRTGSLTRGSANWVLLTGGRLEVGQNSGVHTFKQEMWRVCMVLWRCAALRVPYSRWREQQHCDHSPAHLLVAGRSFGLALNARGLHMSPKCWLQLLRWR